MFPSILQQVASTFEAIVVVSRHAVNMPDASLPIALHGKSGRARRVDPLTKVKAVLRENQSGREHLRGNGENDAFGFFGGLCRSLV
jgi:hypothetical protein